MCSSDLMLRRTRSGALEVAQARTLLQLGAMDDAQLAAALVPVDAVAPAA